MEQGIAYDTTDQLGEMLAMPMDERPAAWLDKMPQACSCWGAARRLGGHFAINALIRFRQTQCPLQERQLPQHKPCRRVTHSCLKPRDHSAFYSRL